MKYKGMGDLVRVPTRVKPEGKPEEELIYANQDEIRMLKEAGGSGRRTPFDGIRSTRFVPDDGNRKGQTKNKKTKTTTTSTTTDEGMSSSAGSTDSFHNQISAIVNNPNQTMGESDDMEMQDFTGQQGRDNKPPSTPSRDRDERPVFNTSNVTETQEYKGEPLTLEGL